MSDEKRCAGTTKDGSRCGQKVGKNYTYCIFHDPERKDELQEMRKRAGAVAGRSRKGRAVPPDETPPPPESLADSLVWAAWAARAVATGDLDTSRGNSIARLLSEFRKALEKHESAEKLEEIRRAVKEVTGEEPDLEVLP